MTKPSRPEKLSGLPSRVYDYGITWVGQPDLLEDLLFKSSLHYNELVASRRQERKDQVAAQRKIPDLSSALDALDCAKDRERDLYTAVKAYKSGKVKPKVPPALKKQVKEAKSELVQARKMVAELRKSHLDALVPDYETAREAGKKRLVASRQASGCRMDGNYRIVENGVKLAAKKHKGQLRFKPYDHSGVIGCRCYADAEDKAARKYGTSLEKAFRGDHSYIRIRPLLGDLHVDTNVWWSIPKRYRTPVSYTTASIRVDSECREPVWLDLEIKMHKPLPPDAVIRYAYVVKKQVGSGFEYRLQLTVDSATFVSTLKTGNRAVAVDLGWRHGERVAYLVDSDGNHSEVCVPARVIEGLKYVEQIKAIRDKRMVPMLVMLKTWLGQQDAAQMPEFLSDVSPYITRWRSEDKLHRLVGKMKASHLDGTYRCDDVLPTLLAWARKDQHLGSWESSQRTRCYRHRKDWYYQVAKYIARTYDEVILENPEEFNLTELRQKLPAEDANASKGKGSRRNANSAAPGLFRLLLIDKCVLFGTRLVAIDPSLTTRTCYHCRNTDKWKNPKEQYHICANCGKGFDRDLNAGVNFHYKLGRDIRSVLNPVVGSLELPNLVSKIRNPLSPGNKHRTYKNYQRHRSKLTM